MNNFTEDDKENIIEHLKRLIVTSPNIGIRFIKNHLGLFHVAKRDKPNDEFLSPESWINLLTTN